MSRLIPLWILLLASCSRQQEARVEHRTSALVDEQLAEVALPEGVLEVFAVEGVRTNAAVDREDLDQDGFGPDADPDDENPFAFPGADEIRCNDVDEDGDGTDLCPPDADRDGFAVDLDCDDLDATRNPWVPEEAGDGIDQNCDGRDWRDRDGDGVDDAFDLDPKDPTRTTPAAEIEPEPLH